MTVVALSYLPVQAFLSNNGLPLVGGQLFSYQAGTSTPAATYTDSTGATSLPNPIILNARGEIATATGASSGLWIPPNTGYKFVLEDALGNTIWTIDQVFAPVTNLGAIPLNLIPSITNTFNIGSPSFTWANGYFGTQIFVNGVPVLNNGNIGYIAQTGTETTAGVTAINFTYPPGAPNRYQTNITPGTTDMSAGFAAAALVSGTYPIVLSDLTYLVNTPFVGQSGMTLTSLTGKSTIKTTVSGNHLVSGVNLNNITITNVKFQGANSSTHPLSSIGGFQTIDTGLVTFVTSINIRITDCEFGPFATAVSCIGCTKVFVNRNYIHNWLIYGILGAQCSEASFDNNVIDTSDMVAIVTFTGTVSSGATSATLNANWGYTTGTYGVSFVETVSGNIEIRGVVLTNGQTTATWNGALGAGCNAQTNGNSYGISATGNEAGGTPCKGVSMSYNKIWNIPSWDGLMSHDINGITIVGNDIRNVRTGVDLSLFANTFDRNCQVVGNYIEATSQDVWNGVSAASTGIQFFGATQSITFTGAPNSTATSATLNANWVNETGVYTVQFTETAGGLFELRQVTLTNGATSATWTPGLTANCNAGATVIFTVDTGTIVGNTIKNFGNLVATGSYGAPTVTNAGVIILEYANDAAVTGNVIEGTGTVVSPQSYAGVYVVGVVNNLVINGNVISGNNAAGGIRGVGLAVGNLSIYGNAINQLPASNNAIQLAGQVASFYLGSNPTNSSTPFTASGNLTLATGTTITGIQSVTTGGGGGTQAVTFANGFLTPTTSYKLTLGQSATSVSPPWYTSKAVTGFTLNFTAAFSGNVDWSVTV